MYQMRNLYKMKAEEMDKELERNTSYNQKEIFFSITQKLKKVGWQLCWLRESIRS